MRKLNFDKTFDIVNHTLLILILLIMLYPLYFVIIASFSEPVHVVKGEVVFWLKGFSWDSYKTVFENDSIWNGYIVAIINTVFGTLWSLILTIPAAYALSKKHIRFHGAITTYFVFTMYFGGGLLPSYLNVQNLGLYNKPYTMIILGGLSVYNMIIARTYFASSIPSSLYEAAEIDGCSDFGLFFKIALPLAKPIIAVISLYYAVGRWNEWFSPMIYLNKAEYYPLQSVLRNILLASAAQLKAVDNPELLDADYLKYLIERSYIAESMKYSVIFIASLPMLILYPFIQKYFVKGVMIGSVKG